VDIGNELRYQVPDRDGIVHGWPGLPGLDGIALFAAPDSAQLGGLVGIGVEEAEPARVAAARQGLPLFVRPWQRESAFLVDMF
jgi:hypothetical protein